MKRTILAIGIVSAVLSASCGNSGDKQQDPSVESVAPSEEGLSEEQSNTGIRLSTDAGGAIDPADPQSATQEAAADGALALNPPHGEPGHRCEIPVGAPLNTPASSDASAPQPVNIQQSPVQAAPSGNGTGRINPPHGEPGHDCAVAVGAPLPG